MSLPPTCFGVALVADDFRVRSDGGLLEAVKVAASMGPADLEDEHSILGLSMVLSVCDAITRCPCGRGRPRVF